jgi:cysteinyl-tRNA synthetase
LIVNGEKMSKSKGNYFTLRDLVGKGVDPLVIRYALSSVPYRRKLNFTDDALHQAESSLKRLRDLQLRLYTGSFPTGCDDLILAQTREGLLQFEQAMDDDLNTAQALAALFDLVREVNSAMAEGKFQAENAAQLIQTLEKMNGVLQFWVPLELNIDQQIEELIRQRNEARRAKNFALADEIRGKIYGMGYVLEDTREGVRWKKR